MKEEKTYNLQSELISEKEKNEPGYIQKMTDLICNSLIFDKDHLRKAYNYYNGVMDKDQYRYLEENYGIGSPTSVDFIPLIRKHVDCLIGRHLQNKQKPKITCKDKYSLVETLRQKQLAVDNEIASRLENQLHNNLSYALLSDEDKQNKKSPVDKTSDFELEKLKEDIDRNFISEFESAAQNMLTFLDQNKSVDLYNKKKVLFLDLLVTGQCYYRVTLDKMGETPDIEVLNPIDVFYEKNNNSPYIKDSTRVVVRKFMNKQQIISKYGDKLSNDDLKKLDSQLTTGTDMSSNAIYVRTSTGSLVSNVGVSTLDSMYDNDLNQIYNNYYVVYEVEWLTNNKVKDDNGKENFVTDRYESVRIGDNIYIETGKSKYVTRSIEHPDRCSLSVNGISYSDRNGRPYSLVLATIPIQDKYNILFFFRDSLIASSGIKGDFLDVSQLPEFLGKTPQERLLKWTAYKKKLGIALIDTSQEGNSGNSNLNTIYKGYDDTVSGQALQAIQLAIQQTEDACSAITGIYREQLGGIEQRDAVTNVAVGINQSSIVTKQYHQIMDNITTEFLIDMLNMCKISYSEGMVGSVVLGDKMQKIFTIDPQYFSFTDYDIHIADSSESIQEMNKIEQLIFELVKSGSIDIEVVLEGITSNNLPDLKYDLSQALKKKKKENNQIEQAGQQLSQYEQQLKQMQSEYQKIKNELDSLKNTDRDLERQKIKNAYEIAKESNQLKDVIENKKLTNDSKKVEIEFAQLYDENPYNNKIKQ